MPWIDTHCHLDASEFGPDQVLAVQARRLAAERGVSMCVLPAVGAVNFDGIRMLAHRTGDAYALGIHPLLVPRSSDDDLRLLDEALTRNVGDPRLVAVGEIGLDFFVPELKEPAMRERQQHFFKVQLQLARRHGLPIIVHTRRSVDVVHKHLRALAGEAGWSGIAHAFNGSRQQADSILALGMKLGFGGAVTFDTALQLRRLATELPADAIVMETDSPDIPPQWLYATAAERATGKPQGLNTPAELPRIGGVLAGLRGEAVDVVEAATTRNALAALPRLAALMDGA
jgi:TatD DNase family protein